MPSSVKAGALDENKVEGNFKFEAKALSHYNRTIVTIIVVFFKVSLSNLKEITQIHISLKDRS